ncbi:hypothetical protein [Methylocaldum szegediense]|uniref:hypothetical protein n=1 Tax=Methylocaldum szegediense TaxID=73780 RepID=UPI0003F845DA|nr:hypothetical protein [Methylocaldum szegediense]
MPTQLDITPTPAPTLTGLVLTPTIKGVQLKWDIPADSTHASTEIWHSEVDDFNTATKLDEIKDNAYVHVNAPVGVLRYYWIRSRNIYGRTDGVLTQGFATPAAAQTDDIAQEAVTVMLGASSFVSQSIVNYGVWEISMSLFSESTVDTNALIHIQNHFKPVISAIGATGGASVLGRLSIIRNTFVKLGTVTVTQNSPIVTGSGTNWLSTVSAGDVFFVYSNTRYMVQSVDSDTQITLTTNYAASSESDVPYYILTTSTILLQRIHTLMELTVVGSQLYSHRYPFNYTIPLVIEAGYTYDVYFEWAKTRSDANWGVSVSSDDRAITLVGLKR